MAENGSNGVWRGEIEGNSSIFIASLFHESWGSQEIRRFMIFITTLMFLIANDKMLCYKL